METPLGKLKVLARNMEKFLTFNIGVFKFIDSLEFLPASLGNLVENLKEQGMSAFGNTRKLSEKQLTLLVRKQVYPYLFCKKLDDYNFVGLPPRKHFSNILKGESEIPEKEYQHALKMYNAFGCKTFLDYHLLYLKTDVTLLADVFEHHRKMCQREFGLDCSYYLSNPHFCMDVLL